MGKNEIKSNTASLLHIYLEYNNTALITNIENDLSPLTHSVKFLFTILTAFKTEQRLR